MLVKRLKPEEAIMIDGTLVRNITSTPIRLLIVGKGKVTTVVDVRPITSGGDEHGELNQPKAGN